MQFGVYIGPIPITYYGCVLCQKEHRQGLDPEYDDHIYRQSKHGIKTRAPLDFEEEFAAHLQREEREAKMRVTHD